MFPPTRNGQRTCSMRIRIIPAAALRSVCQRQNAVSTTPTMGAIGQQTCVSCQKPSRQAMQDTARACEDVVTRQSRAPYGQTDMASHTDASDIHPRCRSAKGKGEYLKSRLVYFQDYRVCSCLVALHDIVQIVITYLHYCSLICS